MSDLMERLRTKLDKVRPPSILLTGQPKIGKTEMASFAPKPVFAYDDKELGIETLSQAGTAGNDCQFLPAHTKWQDVLDDTQALVNEDHDRKTFIYDTIGGAARLCREWFIETHYAQGRSLDKAIQQFNGFGGINGHRDMLPYFMQWITMLDQLRNKGVMVILLSHVIPVKEKNPSGEDYMQWEPDIHGVLRSELFKWADCMVMADHLRSVNDDDMKVKGDVMRVLRTQPGPGYSVGGRFRGLPDMIDMGATGQEAWSNFWSALKPLIVKKKEVSDGS
ncbi:AAA family ATPase [Bremerella sp. P1]|uniref:AAA family ATPase n=1 Tax=Bremerella sp. P1 TaxID=3026424 RepID=UPI002367ACD7|nr:AAA family ATPase [Bremerella sp. P1]WDI44748.1 AAA family ATPase [Bremerella sp. P1]